MWATTFEAAMTRFHRRNQFRLVEAVLLPDLLPFQSSHLNVIKVLPSLKNQTPTWLAAVALDVFQS